MAAGSYTVERNDASGEHYIVEWTDGIDGPTAISGPIAEEAFRTSDLQDLIDEAEFGIDELDWYARHSWTVVRTTD
jgi:hypothetical protein